MSDKTDRRRRARTGYKGDLRVGADILKPLRGGTDSMAHYDATVEVRHFSVDVVWNNNNETERHHAISTIQSRLNKLPDDVLDTIYDDLRARYKDR